MDALETKRCPVCMSIHSDAELVCHCCRYDGSLSDFRASIRSMVSGFGLLGSTFQFLHAMRRIGGFSEGKCAEAISSSLDMLTRTGSPSLSSTPLTARPSGLGYPASHILSRFDCAWAIASAVQCSLENLGWYMVGPPSQTADWPKEFCELVERSFDEVDVALRWTFRYKKLEHESIDRCVRNDREREDHSVQKNKGASGGILRKALLLARCMLRALRKAG